MSDRGSNEIGSVAVRTRRTVGATRRLIESMVMCPRLERLVPPSQCPGCEHCTGAENDRRGVRLHCTQAAPCPGSEAPLDLERLSEAANHTLLSDVMTQDVLCVFPDLPVEQLADLLTEAGISGTPVVDETGIPIGVVSRSDLVGGIAAGATAGDIMMPLAFTLPETASLSRAAALMAYEGVHRIPVVAASGRVIGIVSALDVSRWLAEIAGTMAVCR